MEGRVWFGKSAGVLEVCCVGVNGRCAGGMVGVSVGCSEGVVVCVAVSGTDWHARSLRKFS